VTLTDLEELKRIADWLHRMAGTKSRPELRSQYYHRGEFLSRLYYDLKKQSKECEEIANDLGLLEEDKTIIARLL